MSLTWVFTRIIIILIIPGNWQTNLSYHFRPQECYSHISTIFLSVQYSSGWWTRHGCCFQQTRQLVNRLCQHQRYSGSSFWVVIVKTWNMTGATYSLKKTWRAISKLWDQWKRIFTAHCMCMRTLIKRSTIRKNIMRSRTELHLNVRTQFRLIMTGARTMFNRV